MIETDSLIEVSVGTAEGGPATLSMLIPETHIATLENNLLARSSKLTSTNWVMICNLFNRRHQSNADEDSRLEVVLPLLLRRCQNLRAERDAPRSYADEKKEMAREVESISQTLGSSLLEHTVDVFLDACEPEHPAEPICQASNIDYDRQLDMPSMFREIGALQAKLNETVDEDEQRALEEDVTGMILWLCWCGICAEVDELLPKVVDYLRREANMRGLFKVSSAILFRMGTDPGDDETHLQRIMRDAGAGTLKHQLLLAARAAEQAKWSGANRCTTAIENGGTFPSTSSQAPSIPVV
ncbi:hypothetical protein EDC04DRAFT_791421 [Pisolithus marmoratus]|nr:hypothetical protein EDC04DRAFT_791421 [Pisolithus marmoratus]